MAKPKPKKTNQANKFGKESGQSTVEFVLTFIMILGIIFLYVQLSLGFAWGNFIHYATFMSARALQAADTDPQAQAKRAFRVLVAYIKAGEQSPNVDKFPQLAKGVGGQNTQYASDFANGVYIGSAPIRQGGPDGGYPPPRDARRSSWAYGTSFKFDMRILFIPFAGESSIDTLSLQSDSYLGREPTVQECIENLKNQGGAYGMPIYDNGC